MRSPRIEWAASTHNPARSPRRARSPSQVVGHRGHRVASRMPHKLARSKAISPWADHRCPTRRPASSSSREAHKVGPTAAFRAAPFITFRRDCAPASRLPPSQARRPRVRLQQTWSIAPRRGRRADQHQPYFRGPHASWPHRPAQAPATGLVPRPVPPSNAPPAPRGRRTDGLPPRSSQAASSVSLAGRGSSDTGSTPTAPYGSGRPKASRGRA